MDSPTPPQPVFNQTFLYGARLPPVAPEITIVVHGLGATRPIMMPLCWRLERMMASPVVNYGFRSLTLTLEKAAEDLATFIRATCAGANPPVVHFVGHSLGGIIIRAALAQVLVPRKGRMVFLATPHRGTKWADWFLRVLRWIPVVMHLRRHESSYVHKIHVPRDWEVGTIGGVYDWLVPDRISHMEGEKEHITLHVTHSLVFNRITAVQTTAFLRHGKFIRRRWWKCWGKSEK